MVEDVKQNNAYTDSLLGRERLGESVADSSNSVTVTVTKTENEIVLMCEVSHV